MRLLRSALLALPVALLGGPLVAAEKAPTPAGGGPPKRVLLVTHSGGFIHDSVGVAEDVLTQIGPKYGLTVTTYRLTNPADPAIVNRKAKGGKVGLEAYAEDFRGRTGKTIDPEHTGTVDKTTLKNFDCVLFFTTGNPLTKEQVGDLTDWVKAGGAFCGTHCATDTLYGDPAYGELIGAYFSGHPPGIQKIKVRVDDPKHPAAVPFTDGDPDYADEIYVFREKGNFKQQPFSREKVHVILSCAPGSFDPKGLTRPDNDYAISWVKEYGAGRVFYTSFGHQQSVWKDPKFQAHLTAGLKWAMEKGLSEPRK